VFNALEPWHIIVLVVVLIALFGYKRLPAAARGLGQSMRIFKSEAKQFHEESGASADGDTQDSAQQQFAQPGQDTQPDQFTRPQQYVQPQFAAPQQIAPVQPVQAGPVQHAAPFAAQTPALVDVEQPQPAATPEQR
jgi:sec-independent protein translocase protein TatA